ncbi:hypothetical protein SAMN04244553_4904 [Nocardia amikacinitolerans]|uniref:Uncharacterized protein n=1 Tax=Nocardia amikacinitolerans TaxID=756689 RepID=A0A285LSM5_9NOCA|nr:hypothetical protein [Nocardia amikacinitolerans]MCP2277043.1 hypothetical protein [Nocardia amikacinitolerans]MCP2295617.1 hypothetical protein [Nocardia amikacinitolerans]SNY87944.1 hypothetical protein SAMN04244553_4904 [Nocardia amikacinitolerans]
MAELVDQSVLDMLRQSAVGPMLDRPVNDVLKDMGLPQLPEIPLLPPIPGLPPLPVIDLSLLAKPLTDLAATFGTGQFPAPTPAVAPAADGDPAAQAAATAAPVVDPTEVLNQVSSVVSTVVQLGSTALTMAMQLWQSQAAAAAEEKGKEAQKDGAKIATQAAQESAGVASAATSVFIGGATMAAIIAKYMAQLAASAPFLSTPGGQAFLVAATVETMAEATATVAKTRAEMTVHSAEMTATGQKVPVTDAPKGMDQMQMLSMLMQMIPTLTNTVKSGVESAVSLHKTLNPAASTNPALEKDKAEHAALNKSDAKSGGGGIGGLGGGGGAVAAAARQLSPWVDGRTAGNLGAAGANGVGNPASAMQAGASSAARSSTTAASSPGGMMPMSPMAAAGMARGAEDATNGLRGELVSASHGNEVVGDIEGASLPVVGAATADGLNEPPDQALTL